MTITEAQRSRLPKWALSYINRLEQSNQDLLRTLSIINKECP